MKKSDALVIGSGISSLTAALLLARAGKSVTVLEQHVKAGGFMHCFNRFGLTFDTGAHYVGAMAKGEPFRVLLEHLGIYDESLFVPLDNAGFDQFSYPDLQFGFSAGYAQTVQSLRQLFPSEQDAIQRYFAAVQEAANRFPTYRFNENYDPALLDESITTPLSRVVESLTDNPKLKNVFYSYCALHGVAPDDIAFGFHAIITDSMLNGAVGFKAGGDALAQKFVEAIRQNGGEVLTRKRVMALAVEGKSVKAVTTQDGETYGADWILSGIHPKSLFRMISRMHFSPAFLNRLEATKESAGFFGIYAKCRVEPEFERGKNYFFYANSDAASLFDSKAQASLQFAFVCRPDREPKSVGPYPLTIHAPSPIEWFDTWKGNPYGKRDLAYNALKEKIAESVLDLVERHVPGLRQNIEAISISTPLSTLHFNGSEDGSSYGIYHSIQQTGARALGPRTHLNNLLLTGQSTLIPGLLASAISGLRTAGHILGIKPLLKELRLRMESGL